MDQLWRFLHIVGALLFSPKPFIGSGIGLAGLIVILWLIVYQPF